MRILYISEIYPDEKRGLGVWGGGERQFLEISRRIANSGNNVTVLTCRFPNQPFDELIGNIRIIRCGLSRDPKTGGARRAIFPIIHYIFKSAIIVTKLRPDVIHCNTYFPVYVGWATRLFRKVPVVNTFHDIYGLDGWIKSQKSCVWGFLGHIATTLATRSPANQIIAVSPQCREKLINLGVPSKKIKIVSNGVDLALFNSLSVSRNQFQILYVGRLVNFKHVDWLIKAFHLVLKEFPSASLKIVGSGPEWENLHKLVKKLNLEKVVTFTGKTSTYYEVTRYFKESSIFVLPSTVEGEAIVLKEAMAAHLPLIAMNIPGSGVLSLVKNERNGFLIESGKIEIIANRITELLVNREKARQFGENGYFMIKEYDWNVIAKQTYSAYEEAIRENRDA